MPGGSELRGEDLRPCPTHRRKPHVMGLVVNGRWLRKKLSRKPRLQLGERGRCPPKDPALSQDHIMVSGLRPMPGASGSS